MADLAAIFADPATYFRTVPERNNLKLIGKMITSTRIGVTCLNTGARTQYRGYKIAFPSDWARIVNWNCVRNETSESFTAIGTETDAGIEYGYSSYRAKSHVAGTLTFDPLTGALLKQTCDSYHLYSAFELLAMLAPPAIVHAHFTCRLVEDKEYEYAAVVAIAGEKPALFQGIRGDHDNGWARTIQLNRASTRIQVNSRINMRKQTKYTVCVSCGDVTYKHESKLTLDAAGALISAGENPDISTDAILALVRPRS